jgi:hypothetical protein
MVCLLSVVRRTASFYLSVSVGAVTKATNPFIVTTPPITAIPFTLFLVFQFRERAESHKLVK